ncbi:redox-sensing transcriptional repressor Rex [Thermodesulfobacteriota bacterium]
MDIKTKIPKATITRLSLYCRQLELLEFDGYRMVSSEKMAWLCQVNPAQVRKDLGYFGEFGIRGVGYDVLDLQNEIKKILAINREWNMGIVGIGNLGSALLMNRNFSNRGFHFVAAFDSAPEKIGNVLSTGLKIRDTKELKETAKELDIDIGVIATRSSSAQKVVDGFIDAGVNAILNFSPIQLNIPDHCIIEQIDFTIKLDILTYKLKHEMGKEYIIK